MRPIELNAHRNAHEESIGTIFDLDKKCVTGTTFQ